MPTANVLQRAELVLFDYSGTLCNDEDLVFEANQRLREHHQLPRLTEDEWRNSQPGSGEDDLEEYIRQYAALKAERGVPPLYPGAISLLMLLRTQGKAVEVISSHPQAHLDEEFALNGLGELVPRPRGSISDKRWVIGKVMEDGDYSPDQTAYVGDTVGDMKAAQHNNIGTIALTHGYHSEARLREQNPDIVAPSLIKLATYL